MEMWLRGIKAYNPILAGQVSREEIELCSKNPDKKLSLLKKVEEVEVRERKNQNILHYLKDKIDLMQYYGYAKMHRN